MLSFSILKSVLPNTLLVLLFLSFDLVLAQSKDENQPKGQTGGDRTTQVVEIKTPGDKGKLMTNDANSKIKKATFGAGCFWCVEAVFQRLEGVQLVESGYMGGEVENPTYKQVCTGSTGHAEVVHITYDSEKVDFKTLLEVFWKTHDPTTLNRQGNDTGTQYRSAVFFHDDDQKKLAETYKAKLNEAGAFDNPIVTEITAASKMYVAEKYHQNFWNEKGQGNGYCRSVIPPKLEKLKKVFGDKLKK